MSADSKNDKNRDVDTQPDTEQTAAKASPGMKVKGAGPIEPPFWLSKRNILLWIFAAAILLTVYAYLDRHVFAPNRPIIWQEFRPESVDQLVRADTIVVLLVGEFQSSRDSDVWVKKIDVPAVRREAHRLRSAFTIASLEGPDQSKQPIREWIADKLNETPDRIPEEPFVLILYKKWDQPAQIDPSIDLAGKIGERMSSIRKAKTE